MRYDLAMRMCTRTFQVTWQAYVTRFSDTWTRDNARVQEREREIERQVTIQEDQAGELGLLLPILSTTIRGL